MQHDCANIYQSARKIAGLTQERAAELLGLSVRCLADYESGLRLPPSDVADLMVVVYNSQLLAVQHLRECTRFARDLLPDVRAMALPEAVITLVEAIHDFSAGGLDHELLRIARDGVVSADERARFDHAVDALRSIAAAAIALASIPRGGGTVKGGSQWEDPKKQPPSAELNGSSICIGLTRPGWACGSRTSWPCWTSACPR